VNFNPEKDQLWAAGDIVNRGPQSLETLRYVKSLGTAFKMVLGNHDLHLLATARGIKPLNTKDTLSEILNATDREELLSWLQQQPLLLYEHGYVMVHAGIPPQWTLKTALTKAKIVESIIQSENADLFFNNMYGNFPCRWQESQTLEVQLRTITNYFTRMRFCDLQGNLELSVKEGADKAPEGFSPWYSHSKRKTANQKIIFGHWAALEGNAEGENLFPLDTGCIWGGRLRLMNLTTRQYSHCSCS
jgi:bis(5'-nucleosyl)-tetraphosphatase (symmetrical)